MHVAHRCNDGYHIHCLTPPLPYIPPGEWFCTGCIQAMRDVERKGAATAAIWGGAWTRGAAPARMPGKGAKATATSPAPVAAAMGAERIGRRLC